MKRRLASYLSGTKREGIVKKKEGGTEERKRETEKERERERE